MFFFTVLPVVCTPRDFPELRLPNMEMTVEQCVDALVRLLENAGILTGGPADPTGLTMPDGDEIIDLHVDPRLALVSHFSTVCTHNGSVLSCIHNGSVWSVSQIAIYTDLFGRDRDIDIFTGSIWVGSG